MERKRRKRIADEPRFHSFAATTALMFGLLSANPTVRAKTGWHSQIYHRDSPASMSILEEGTNSTEIPMMGVFNNLVMYDQHVAQNSLSSIVPDLATSWSTSEDGKQLTFRLREASNGMMANRSPPRMFNAPGRC